MRFPFNRTETIILLALFPVWFLLHWNGFLDIFYSGIANKVGSTTAFWPALASSLTLYILALVLYYFLRKTCHDVLTNKWFLLTFGVLTAGFIGLGAYLHMTDFFAIDVCLDRGGSWNYSVKKCETNESVETLSRESLPGLAATDLPPLEPVQIQHQAWVHYLNMIGEDYFDEELCWGQVPIGDGLGFSGVEKIKVKDGYLMLVWCDAGAYNMTYSMALVSDNEGVIVEFPELDEQDLPNNNSPYAVNLSYDPASKLFSMFHKGRGLGDCGASAEYKWSDDQKQLIMREFRAKEECDGKNIEWPVVYRLQDAGDKLQEGEEVEDGEEVELKKSP